jgi:hypothetical protein
LVAISSEAPFRNSKDVKKSSIRLVVWHSFHNDLDISTFIERRREAFESVAPLPPFPKACNDVPLWTASIGWGDTGADWSSIAKEIAEHTQRWVEILAEFVASARAFRDSESATRAASKTPEVYNIR